MARAPGRFDLLGGHNDYLGYPVCAAALKEDILVAVSESECNSISLKNTDKLMFPDREFSIE